jgi:hypothetical protein
MSPVALNDDLGPVKETTWERADKAKACRLQLLAAGFVPVPLNGKIPAHASWQRPEPPDHDEIKSWSSLCATAVNTGILTRLTPAIDIDVLDGAVAGEIMELAAALIGEEMPFLVRFGLHPKRAIIFRAEQPFKKMRTAEFISPDGRKHHVEILCDGQQLAAFGQHPDTGQPYEWPHGKPGDIKHSELPLLTEGMASRFIADASEIMVTAGWRRERPAKPAAVNGAAAPAGDAGFRERQYAQAALGGCASELTSAGEGARNDVLNAKAFRLGTMVARGWLARDKAFRSLLNAAKACGLNEVEARRTCKSGLDAGEKHPAADLGAAISNPQRKNTEPDAAAADTAEDRGTDDAGWPEPDLAVLRLHRRPPPPLPLEVFGDRWARWIADTARASACPPDYVAAPLLASASALIGHARWAQATRSWAEPPHLWCASVGDSGDGKSPGADSLARDILPAMERRTLADFPDRLREAQAAIEAAKARIEHWKTRVREALKAGRTPPPPPGQVPEEPLAPCLMSSDATIERVAMLLTRAAPKGLLMRRDELAGWLLGMNNYNDGARAFWLEAYGGRPYRVDRVKHPEPIIIPRLAVAWHGGIQPARLAEVMRDADDGLLARFIWFWPEPVPFHIANTAPEVGWATAAFDRLRTLELTDGEPPRPIMVLLAPAAVQAMERFGQLLQGEKEGSGGLLRSAIGKARGWALRLSLVLAYLRWCAEDGYAAPPDVIPEDTFLAAAKLVAEYILPMAERTFGDAACPAVDRNAATLARWIAREPPSEVHVRHLQREVWLPGLGTADAIHAACRVLVEAGWLKEPRGGDAFQQRRRAAYPVSPRLKDAPGAENG